MAGPNDVYVEDLGDDGSKDIESTDVGMDGDGIDSGWMGSEDDGVYDQSGW